MDESRHRSVDFTERVEKQENLGSFWLAVYNLRANGGSRNIIAFSYADCCLYQMEMHLYRVWDQIYSIWIWLHHLTVQLKTSTLDWQETVTVQYMQCECVCISFSVCAGFAALFLHYGGRPWFSQQHAAAGRPPLSLPWGEQLLHKHVGVWAMSPWLPSSPSRLLLLVQSHRHSASDINSLSSLLINIQHAKHFSSSLLNTSATLCFHSERKYRVCSKLVSAQNSDTGASDL